MNSESDFDGKLRDAKNLPEIFELVKEVVRAIEDKRRAGLMLGIAELGGDQSYFVGAFYPVASNLIVMNKTPMDAIRAGEPKLLKPYVFHVLLHEYLHSLGIYNELETRKKAYEISAKAFGEQHVLSKMALDIGKFIKGLIYPNRSWKSLPEISMQLVKGFDYSNYPYIS